MTPATVMQLQRSAGNAAVARLMARSQAQPVVQRDVVTGDDPVAELLQDGNKGLLYGNSTARKHTSLRGQATNAAQWGKELRTIDAYNDEIGLSDFMAQSKPQNIFKIREVLAKPTAVADWGAAIPPRDANYANNPDLAAWVGKLRQEAEYVGMYNLGAETLAKPSATSLKAVKSRYKKNFNSKDRYKKRQKKKNTAQYIHQWLGRNVTFAAADAEAGNLSKDEHDELAGWIRKAFWRRSSKLGIDFTIGRGHRIHMNTAADKNFDVAKGVPMTLKPGDQAKMKEKYGRMITTSEYRHLVRGIKSGRLDPRLVNFYDEISH